MQCDEANQLIELYLLDELSPKARQRFVAHLARCADCRRAVAQYRRIIADFRSQADKPAPRPEFAASLQQAVADEIRSQHRHRRWQRASLTAAAAAAVLVLATGLWQAGFLSTEHQQPAPIASLADPNRSSAGVREVWSRSGAQALTASPADTVVIRGSSMYFLRRDATGDRVVAVNATTGELLWQSDQPSRGYIAVDDARVYCLSSSGRRTDELLALDARDGSVLWRYSPEGGRLNLTHSRAVPVAGGRVCWTGRQAVHVLAADTGRAMWKRTIAGEGTLAAAADEDGLCVASTTAIRRLDIETGDDIWAEPLGGPARLLRRPLLALAGGKAFMVRPVDDAGSRLICLDLASRRLLWDKSGGDAQHLLAAADGVYLRGRRVRAYDSRSGELLWSRDTSGCGPLTSDEGLVHFVDTSDTGRLLALNSHTGETAWEIAGIRSCGAFRRVGGTGFIKTQDGVIHAIALRTP